MTTGSEEEDLRRIMSLLGSRKSEKKKKAATQNAIKARAAQAEKRKAKKNTP